MNTDNTTVKQHRGKKKGLIAGLVIIAAAAVIGAGTALYLRSDTYQCSASIKRAEECLKRENYEEALFYCREALATDEAFADAYLRIADICMATGSYGEGEEYLWEGMTKTEGKKKEGLQEKLEELYRAEAEYLVGTWIYVIDYDLLNFLPDFISDAIGWEMQVETIWEFREDGTVSVRADKDSYAEGTGKVAEEAVSHFAGSDVAGAAGKTMEFLTGLLFGKGKTIDGSWQAENNILHLNGSTPEAYIFRIDGNKLQLLEQIEPEESALKLKFPIEMERQE